MRKALRALGAAALATTTLVVAPTTPTAASAVAGATEAPDLTEVGNFRPGPTDADGSPQTLVDYTFDAIAYLNGGDRSNFHLIPLDGGDDVDARGIEPEADEEGDNVVTVLYSGTLDPTDYARGYLDTGVVNSAAQDVSPDDPANINQSAPISNEGRTANPDLISVTRDGDQVLFEFDQDLTEEDVVQDTGGLRIYFPEAEEEDRIPDAGAQAVKRKDARTLRAIFDLPEGKTLDDAVGGFVTRGTVQGVDGEANDRKNAFDEHRPMDDTGATVCEQYAPVDTAFIEAGPTEAPDLATVDNFRRGPFTSQFEPTTCVDFTFDQVAYLNGGNRSNFHLVPLDGGDALDGTTNVTPESDEPGDNTVTVIFEGEIEPEEIARGFVDSGVVNSDPEDISADAPANVNQAEDVTPVTETDNPDLVRVSRDATPEGEDTFLFEFDQALNEEDKAQNSSGLRLFFAEAEQQATIPSIGSSKVEVVDDRTLRAFYEGVVPDNKTLDDVVGAFVDQGTVEAANGGANDGSNAFDEVFIFGVNFPDLTPVCNGLLATIVGEGEIKGTSGPDVIVGSPADDTINGKGGDDVICGRQGDDLLKGEKGDDVLLGEQGLDELRGQAGADLLYSGDGADLLKGDTGDDLLFAGRGDDDLRGQEDADFFDGGPGTDVSDYDEDEDIAQIRVP